MRDRHLLSLRTHVIRRGREERGAVTVIIAIMIIVLLGMAAMVVDIGAAQARKAQLQDAADAAALGIAQRCFESTLTLVSGCAADIRATATGVAGGYATQNVNDGSANVTSVAFTASTVTVTLTSSQPSFFAQIWNVDDTTIHADATADWGQGAVPLPLAYHACSLPAPSATATVFLRYDLLDPEAARCGLIPGVMDLLGPGWVTQTDLISLDDGLSLLGSDCSYSVDLVAYVSTTLTKVLPTQCAASASRLVGKQVLLPVYDRVLVPIVVNGVLLGNGYRVTKYALVKLTGYDFQTLDVNLLNVVTATIGPKQMPATGPHCPDLLGIPGLETPTCQGVQGVLQGFMTPAEAQQLLLGVHLID